VPERFRHIVLPSGRAEEKKYQPIVSGRGEEKPPPRYPDRDPEAHGRKLTAELAEVRRAASAMQVRRKEQGIREASGSQVTFELAVNPDLPLDRLEDRGAGIEIVAFRGGPNSPDEGTATVFVPDGKLGVFERKLRDYLDPEKETQDGLRRNTPLFHSIHRIRRTVLQDLWTDPTRPFPAGLGAAGVVWWEVWLRAKATAEAFRSSAVRLGLGVGSQELHFPDRTVVLAEATVEQMILSVDLLDAIAELRSARGLQFEFLELEHGERERAMKLRGRLQPAASGCPAVCLLDTGVDIGHPLLAPALPPAKALTYNPSWGADDHHGHGTEMAGFALFGAHLDRLLVSDEPVVLRHAIESVKILPRTGRNDPALYGDITLSAAALIEIEDPARPRVFSLSVTDEKCPHGRPTSWSGAVDQLAAGAGEEHEVRRLVFVSAGNADTASLGYSYPESNHTDCVEDPAQAWNALTIGGFTEKELIQEGGYRDWKAVAPAGDLSPCSTTALTWSPEWANKPDLVLEAGNSAWNPAATLPERLDSLSLLTTRRRLGSRWTAWSGDTSAATAAAARLGALVLAEYPDLWPETVRALLVHSARWTPAMVARFEYEAPRTRAHSLLGCFGYGVPDLDRALYSLRHHLTLVVQDTIQPYVIERLSGVGSQAAKSRQMHLHELPWPEGVLESLGALQVRLRVTLSYFIEPKPGQRGASRRHRYASVGLRFAVKTATESTDEFLHRINGALREKGEKVGASDTAEWALGQQRDRGSVHSDVWCGPAAKLAGKGTVAVFPVIGWWRDAGRPDLCNRRVRYSLVASIESDATEAEVAGALVPVDFITEVVNQIGIAVETVG
jgi:hypothetical protein